MFVHRLISRQKTKLTKNKIKKKNLYSIQTNNNNMLSTRV